MADLLHTVEEEAVEQNITSVEGIQDQWRGTPMGTGLWQAKNYILYRQKRSLLRDARGRPQSGPDRKLEQVFRKYRGFSPGGIIPSHLSRQVHRFQT